MSDLPTIITYYSGMNVGQKVTGQKVKHKVTDEKSQFKFCVLTKHLGQKVIT